MISPNRNVSCSPMTRPLTSILLVETPDSGLWPRNSKWCGCWHSGRWWKNLIRKTISQCFSRIEPTLHFHLKQKSYSHSSQDSDVLYMCTFLEPKIIIKIISPYLSGWIRHPQYENTTNITWKEIGKLLKKLESPFNQEAGLLKILLNYFFVDSFIWSFSSPPRFPKTNVRGV